MANATGGCKITARGSSDKKWCSRTTSDG